MGKRKINKYTFHLMIWIVLFSLPYLLTFGQDQVFLAVFKRHWVPLLMFLVVFYLNYIFLVDRFLFKNKTLQFIAINAILIVLLIFLRQQLNFAVLDKLFSENERKGPPIKIALYLQTISSIVPIIFSIALKTTERWSKTETERKEAVNVKLQSDLQFLSYQLQPHFFFNSLNNIYSLVDISPEKAKSTIHSLSKLMRYLLYETNVELVPLSKEIDFMKKYIELMKLRVSEKTKIEYNFPTNVEQIQIAPLLFISLIENAFKHGVSAQQESIISIDMSCNKNGVVFNISNGNFPKKSDDKSGSGIGVNNLKQRLELLYPNKHNYKSIIENERYSVVLEIET